MPNVNIASTLSYQWSSRLLWHSMLFRSCFSVPSTARLRITDKQRCVARFHRWYSSERLKDEPLRILFCGTDDFSVTSLRALYHYSKLIGSNVASIDVATKTDKRTGRGRKDVTSTPIKHAAEQLMLPVHQFDTFRGWNLPKLIGETESHINMVVAVSFGLLVPPRILGSCQYGGLNVHPSMLPDLKGSAPVEHAIINGYTRTGVSVQTLHPSKFDEGEILLQTPSPGLAIPQPNSITAASLKDVLADFGADMLVQTLKDRLYLQHPHQPQLSQGQNPLNHAPKFTTESYHMDFKSMSSTRILRMSRALKGLWTRLGITEGTKGLGSDARLIFGSNIRLALQGETEHLSREQLEAIEPGRPFFVCLAKEQPHTSMAALLVKAADGNLIAIPQMTISGLKPGNSSALAARAHLLREGAPLGQDRYRLYEFSSLLT